MDNQMNSLWAKKIAESETRHQTISTWVSAASAKDGAALLALFSDDIALLPPFVDDPIYGPQKALETLGFFSRSTRNFSYGRTWVSEDTAVLEFKAEIGAQVLHGLDLIQFDDAGKIVRFEVMARPHSAVALLRAAFLAGNAKGPI